MCLFQLNFYEPDKNRWHNESIIPSVNSLNSWWRIAREKYGSGDLWKLVLSVHKSCGKCTWMNYELWSRYPGIIMGMSSSKKRRSYIVTSSLIGCPYTKNDPCHPSKVDLTLHNMLNLRCKWRFLETHSLCVCVCVCVLTPHVFQLSMILWLRCDVILYWTKCHKASWWTNWTGLIATKIATASKIHPPCYLSPKGWL